MKTIGFHRDTHKDIKETKLEIPVNFTHSIILGATGSGKTASCITPILLDRMQKNHGILIFDFKGNYHYTVKAAAKQLNKLQNIKEIGSNYNYYINILENIPIEMIETLLHISLGYNETNKFWDESAISFAMAILGIIKCFNELNIDDYKYNFKSLISIVKSMKNIKDFKKFTLEKVYQLFRYENAPHKLYLINNILNHYHSLDAIADEDSLNRAIDSNERTVLHSVVATLINPITRLSKDIINENEINILDELIKGNIVVLSLNDFDENTLNTIVTSIFSQIRFNKLHSQQPITIIMDEAQKIINNYFELPLDILREYKVDVILATQSIANLKEKVKLEKIDSILANIRTKIYLDGVDMNLPKYTAYVNDEAHIKLTPLEFTSIEKFEAEYEYQKQYSKLQNNPQIDFLYKNTPIIYIKHSDTTLLMKDKNFDIVGQTNYTPIQYNKNDLLKKFYLLKKLVSNSNIDKDVVDNIF